jgi:hypothetical protein
MGLYERAPLNQRCWVSFALLALITLLVALGFRFLGVETRGRPIALGEGGRSPMRTGIAKTMAS